MDAERPRRVPADAIPMALVRAALWLLPRRFRHAHADDMMRLFGDRYREAREGGWLRRTRLLMRTLIDLGVVAIAERRRSSFLPENLPQTPDHDGDSLVKNFFYDLRHARRAALKRPAYTAIVVLTLAVGIGANTSIFTVVNGVLLRPLPYDDPEGLMRIYGRFDPESGLDFAQFTLSEPEYVDYRADNQSMSEVAAHTSGSVTLTSGNGDPERVTMAYISAGLMPLLRVEPVLGRVFSEQEDLPGADPVALLGHGLWQTRFGGADDIVGRPIVVNGVSRLVVGVMPESFAYPFASSRMWLPLGIDPARRDNRSSHYFSATGRLRQGVSLQQASAEMDVMMSGWATEYPDIHTGHYLFIRPLLEDVVGDTRAALLMLLAASGFVLLIVCANVASMLLARGEDRSREIAVRAALGAGGRRLAQLVIGESLLLSAAGAVLGVGMASFGVRALLQIGGGLLPRASAVSVDPTVLGFALMVTLATATLFSLGPVLHTARVDLRGDLVEGSGHAGTGSRRVLFRQGLVVAEVALCFMLVLGAGLMIRSYSELTRVDPGYRTDGILLAGLALPAADYPEAQQVQGFFRRLLDRVRAIPGVDDASVSTTAPMFTANGVWDFDIEGQTELMDSDMAGNAAFRSASPGYFDVMGVRLLSGRRIEPTDTLESEPVAWINAELGRRFFPGVDPLGRRIRVEGDELPWMRIVGVVDDVRSEGLGIAPQPAYYAVNEQTPLTAGTTFRFRTLIARTGGDPQVLLGPLREILRELDPNLPLGITRTMADLIATSVARPRFTTLLLSLFAGVALLLGASGIYGVLSYSVAQRTRELGIRKALGAQSPQLMRMVVRQGMVPVVAGLLAGGSASLLLGRLMSSLLFGISPNDATTYVMVAATLLLVALVACFAPTLRAVRMDPLIALHSE